MDTIKLGKQNIHDREVLREKNDCTVRALMEVLGVSYLEAYGYLIGAGRKKNRGINCHRLFDSLSKAVMPRPNMMVRNYITYIAHTGKFVIETRGHVFAVIEGEIKDGEFPQLNLNNHVVKAWRF